MIDEHLIERCRRGSREAREELFNRTIGPVFRLLVRMTGNADDAADLAQETYLRAFSSLGEFRGRSSVETWLFRIAVNEALQARRRAKSAGRHLRIKGRLDDREATVDEAASRGMDVNAALAVLEPDDRAILLLRYDLGMNYREIASSLDCAEGTVASRLNRARAKMREILSDGYKNREELGRREHQKERDSGQNRGAILPRDGELARPEMESTEW